MATAAHRILGYTGTLGRTISARRRREPKYSKQRQARMIRAILSRRMMSPPSYEDVLDYVDTQVTYAENKREVLAVFGERSRKARVSDKEMREMYCTSLHNECAANGLDTCQTACDECKNPAACKKAERIGKEIKKHGRELSALERTMIYTAKEEKRAVKKAKFSVGQTVKCREGYELQCGFSGSQKITQVKRYPDYVMYGIAGKSQGFVDEGWIERSNGKKVKEKVVSKSKKSVSPPKKQCDVVINGVYYTKYGEPVKKGDKVRWMTLLTGLQEGTLVKAKTIKNVAGSGTKTVVVDVVDSMVIGKGKYYSMRQEGMCE